MLAELVTHEWRALLHSKRLVIVVLLYVVAGALAATVLSLGIREAQDAVVETLRARGLSEAQVRDAILVDGEAKALQIAGDLNENFARYPAVFRSSLLVLLFFFVSLLATPWLVALSTFDVLSSDLKARSLAYYALRVPRWAPVVGRFLAHWAIIVVVNAVAALVFLAIASLSIHALRVTDTALGFARAVLLLIPYSAAWVALTTMCSAATRQPLIALVLTIASFVLLSLLRLPAAFDPEPGTFAGYLAHLQWFAPTAWREFLWFEGLTGWGLGVLGMAGFTCVFLVRATALLKRHDL